MATTTSKDNEDGNDPGNSKDDGNNSKDDR
jgi:hypothetical protein